MAPKYKETLIRYLTALGESELSALVQRSNLTIDVDGTQPPTLFISPEDYVLVGNTRHTRVTLRLALQEVTGNRRADYKMEIPDDKLTVDN